jgi:hypothetical protein
VRRNGLSSAACASPTLVSDQWPLPWIFLPGPGVGGSQPPGSPVSRHGHIDLWAWEEASALPAENADGPPAQADRNSGEGTRRPETAASADTQENGQDGSRTPARHTGLERRP